MADDARKVAETILAERRSESDALIDEIREDLIEWLAQLRFPDVEGSGSWSDCVRLFDVDPEEEEQQVGVKVRLAFRLYTERNQYLISIMECLNPEDKDVHILATHVNWRSGEWEKQKKLDEAYGGRFVDALRGRHTVWTQTFRKGELHGALDAAAKAILGHELVGTPPEGSSGRPIRIAVPVSAEFPARDE